jgi:hypothetical protein
VKTGGGLNFVTGPMGAGKSLYAVRGGVAAMMSGQYWVTNVELMPDAFDRIASRVSMFAAKDRKRAIAEKMRRLYIYETDLSQVLKYRHRGQGEARWRLDWDEGHNDLNNRSWRDEGRGDILKWATQLRKLGGVGFLLTQHGDNTDAALRRVCNFQVRLQNQREQTRMLGMRVTPWPLFLAYWYPAHLGLAGQKIQPTKIERYMLGWHRHLYDTFGLYHGLAADQAASDVVWLGDDRANVLVPKGQADSRGAGERPTLPEDSHPEMQEAPSRGPLTSSRRLGLHAAEQGRE